MSDTNRLLFDFIRRSPTPFHVVQALSERLQAAGCIPLPETASWQLQPGGAYYVTRNGSSLIAFRIPSGDWSGFLITASHSDSPTFQVKENGELAGPEGYLRLNTEPYGGMLMAPWLDRPLSLAGRVAVRLADGTIASRLVDLDRDLLVIPSVAIHMDRSVNKGTNLDPAADLLPLLGICILPAGIIRALSQSRPRLGIADIISLLPLIRAYRCIIIRCRRSSLWRRRAGTAANPGGRCRRAAAGSSEAEEVLHFADNFVSAFAHFFCYAGSRTDKGSGQFCALADFFGRAERQIGGSLITQSANLWCNRRTSSAAGHASG